MHFPIRSYAQWERKVIQTALAKRGAGEDPRHYGERHERLEEGGLREEYAAFDAERIYEVPGVRVADPKACQCGEVLRGVIKPWECKVFGTACTPETPIGTCMVSSEGACAAYYNFGRFSRSRVKAATSS